MAVNTSTGPALLAAGAVPEHSGPLVPGVAYPLALDRAGDRGAVSFAWRDGEEVWCVAIVYTRVGDAWHESGEFDNTTTLRPFDRPETPENSTETWVDWHSNDPRGCFGVAPRGTARLTIDGRELRITPYNGAYVALGDRGSTLAGYAADGTPLGDLTLP